MAKPMSDEKVALCIAGAAIAVIFWEELLKAAITGAVVYVGTVCFQKALEEKPRVQLR